MKVGPADDDGARGLLAYLDDKAYICPKPEAWFGLWRTLPERRWIGGGWEPAAPMMLAQWHASSDADKRVRFRSHIEWARTHGVLASFDEAVQALGPDEWFHH